jgi:hypothetical protein
MAKYFPGHEIVVILAGVGISATWSGTAIGGLTFTSE